MYMYDASRIGFMATSSRRAMAYPRTVAPPPHCSHRTPATLSTPSRRPHKNAYFLNYILLIDARLVAAHRIINMASSYHDIDEAAKTLSYSELIHLYMAVNDISDHAVAEKAVKDEMMAVVVGLLEQDPPHWSVLTPKFNILSYKPTTFRTDATTKYEADLRRRLSETSRATVARKYMVMFRDAMATIVQTMEMEHPSSSQHLHHSRSGVWRLYCKMMDGRLRRLAAADDLALDDLAARAFVITPSSTTASVSIDISDE